jgi:hypothetical protein
LEEDKRTWFPFFHRRNPFAIEDVKFAWQTGFLLGQNFSVCSLEASGASARSGATRVIQGFIEQSEGRGK